MAPGPLPLIIVVCGFSPMRFMVLLSSMFSLYVPARTYTVSLGFAAFTAFCMVGKSSGTVIVADRDSIGYCLTGSALSVKADSSISVHKKVMIIEWKILLKYNTKYALLELGN